MTPIAQHEIVSLIERFINYPGAKICRHLVAARLLNLLENHGVVVTSELASAIVQADDEKALEYLQDLK